MSFHLKSNSGKHFSKFFCELGAVFFNDIDREQRYFDLSFSV